MRLPSRLLALTVVLAARASQADAQDPSSATTAAPGVPGGLEIDPEFGERLPVSMVQRPMQLRRGVIRADVRFQDYAFDFGTSATGHLRQVAVGAAFGVTDDVEIAITSSRTPGIDDLFAGGFGVNWSDAGGGTEYSDLALRGRYAVRRSNDVDLSVELGVSLPILTNLATVYGGIPLRARLAPRFALDMEPNLTFTIDTDPVPGADTVEFSLNVPISGVITPVDNLFLAGRSGMSWQLTNDSGLFDGFWFPLFLEIGGTVGHAGGPLVDVSAEAGFPYFIVPSASDAVVTDLFVVRAKASVSFGL